MFSINDRKHALFMAMQDTPIGCDVTILNLLDRFRNGSIDLGRKPCDMIEKKSDLILEYVACFPKAIRYMIVNAAIYAGEAMDYRRKVESETALFGRPLYKTYDWLVKTCRSISNDPSLACIFHARLYTLIRDFFAYRPYYLSRLSKNHVELIIRFFPDVLTDIRTALCPCLRLFGKPESLVPMCVSLLDQHRSADSVDRYLRSCHLTTHTGNVLQLHLSFEYDYADGYALFPEFDEALLQALIVLKEKGFVTKKDLPELLKWLLEKRRYRSVEHIERRLRLLAGWDPAILGTPDLSFCFYKNYRNNVKDLYIFGILVELGFTYHPKELGLIFHDKYKTSGWKLSGFHLACDRFGTRKVEKIVVDNVLGALGTHTLQELLFVAAANDYMSVQAVYLLARLDPAAWLPSPHP